MIVLVCCRSAARPPLAPVVAGTGLTLQEMVREIEKYEILSQGVVLHRP